MAYRTASGAAKAIALSISVTALALAGALPAVAQQPSTNPPAQAAPAPGAGQAEQKAPGGAEENRLEKLELTASPWTKYCAKSLASKSGEITTKDVCFTAADAHLQTGQKVAIAMLIEPEEGGQKLFRVTLPLGVALVPGTRIVFDEKEAMTAPYVVCLPKDGCMSDYKADADLIAKLKNGKSLAIQGFDKGKPISFGLPLADFAKAYDGPPSDPTGFTGQQGSSQDQAGHSEDHHEPTPGGK